MNANSIEKIQAERPCPISESRECVVVATKAREGHSLRNVMSVKSGLIYADPLPIQDLAGFYRDDYRLSYKKILVPKLKHIYRAGGVALDRWGHAGGAIQPGMRTLDFGAGGGEWVYLLKKIGCESYGVEPNLNYGSFARDEYGVDLFLGTHQEAKFEKGSFDAVTLFQVLEHLQDPVAEIRSMAEYLKPGGLFVIEVPDILFPGMRFDHKWHDGHLSGFDALTLEAVAAKAGLSKRSISVLPGNLFGVFEKREGERAEVPGLEGHFESAYRELMAGRKAYWRMPSTYTKVGRKVVASLSEQYGSRRLGEPKRILDHLYANLGARLND